MNKVPVLGTIGAAYGFTFGRFLTVLGVVWLPYLLLYGFIFGVPMLAGTNMIDLIFSQFTNPQPLTPWYVLGLRVLPFIIGAIITVGALERALGLASGPTFFYFSLGKPVWRMLGAEILALVFFIFAAIVAAIAGGILAVVVAIAMAAAKVSEGAVAGVAVCVMVLLIIAAIVYFALRLLFLLGPVVVAEKRIGLERTLELSKSNAWRLFLIVLGVLLPFLVAEMIIGAVVLMPLIPEFVKFVHTMPAMHMHENMPPVEVFDFTRKFFGDMMKAFGPYLYVWLAVGLIFRVIFTGLMAGASAAAYRALVPETPQSAPNEIPPSEPAPA